MNVEHPIVDLIPKVRTNDTALKVVNNIITQTLHLFDAMVKLAKNGSTEVMGKEISLFEDVPMTANVSVHQDYMVANEYGEYWEDFKAKGNIRIPPHLAVGYPLNIATCVDNAESSIAMLRDMLEEELLRYRDGAHASPSFISSVEIRAQRIGETATIGVTIIQCRFISDTVLREQEGHARHHAAVEEENEGE